MRAISTLIKFGLIANTSVNFANTPSIDIMLLRNSLLRQVCVSKVPYYGVTDCVGYFYSTRLSATHARFSNHQILHNSGYFFSFFIAPFFLKLFAKFQKFFSCLWGVCGVLMWLLGQYLILLIFYLELYELNLGLNRKNSIPYALFLSRIAE